MSSNNDHPESGASPAGLGSDSLPTTTNQNLTSEQTRTANTSISEQNASQQKPDDAVAADAKPTDGGDSAGAAPSTTTTTTTNDTAVAPSNAATKSTVEEPKEPLSESSDAQAKEVESPKKEQDEEEEEEEDLGPSLVITLLLTSGSRHPFKIDGKYLRKQPVNVENNDPFAMSVYTLKELIWREWRPDWESRPSSPSSIRLISFGKLLEDKAPLSASKFNRDAPNVVHMTIKPQEMIEEEDAKGAKAKYTGERDPSVRSPGCRCVIL